MASIFAQMAFNGEFFARMDYVDKKQRMLDLEMEMIFSTKMQQLTSRIWTNLSSE